MLVNQNTLLLVTIVSMRELVDETIAPAYKAGKLKNPEFDLYLQTKSDSAYESLMDAHESNGIVDIHDFVHFLETFRSDNCGYGGITTDRLIEFAA